MVLETAVAADVLDGDSLSREESADQATSVAAARVLLAAEDRHPEMGQAKPDSFQAGLERAAGGEQVFVDAAPVIVERGIARPTTELVAESEVLDAGLEQCLAQRPGVEVGDVTRERLRSSIDQHLDIVLFQQVEKCREWMARVPNREQSVRADLGHLPVGWELANTLAG
jgi:hypothetical protein